MVCTGKNIIGFQELRKGEKWFQSINPVTNKPNPCRFFIATTQEMELALQLATQSYPKFSLLSVSRKIEFLHQIHQNILQLGSHLTDQYCTESGLNLTRALAERKRTLWQIELFIETLKKGHWQQASIDQALPHRKPVEKPDIRKVLEPIGPVVVFGASNFPLAYSTAGGDTISALAAGCPVIVKSHPMHAGTGELVARAIMNAAKSTGMPEGVFSNVNSLNYEAGTFLAQHPMVKGIGFTGSTYGGKALTHIVNSRKNPIPIFAEMGSLNPVVILPEAISENTDHILNVIVQSINLDAGQFCTNPGLIFLMKDENSVKFQNSLVQKLEKVRSQCMLHPQIKANYEKNSVSIKSISRTLLDIQKSIPENHISPIITQTTAPNFCENPNFQEEVFGSFTLMVMCGNTEELENALNTLQGQLTGSIFSGKQELKKHAQIVTILKQKVGRLIFNGVPTGVEVCQSMHHGGPFPSTSNSHFTAVGPDAIKRWTKPVSYQNWPQEFLPEALKNENPLGIMRIIDGKWSDRKI
ncbi:MAG: aldehyde dehydrogenase (NADP(+)) [Salibacteraceae bacterium]